jgi:hypothetical protein
MQLDSASEAESERLRVGVYRVGDVYDDLAPEPIGVLLHGLLDPRVVDGENDDLVVSFMLVSSQSPSRRGRQ